MSGIDPSKKNRTFVSFVQLLAITACLSGCAVPGHMRVTEGVSPENVDKDVRYRATYYFRVIDSCHDPYTGKSTQPEADSLYRFVMTGKANAYANRVRFESGTLKASQIDPFGATVELDKDSGRYRFVSEKEVQADATRKASAKELDEWIERRKKLSALVEDADAVEKTTLLSAIRNIDGNISTLASAGLNPDLSSFAVSPDDTAVDCPAGSQARRGFQIMGPQGIKTYNQDERLLLAMTSDARPLMAALSESSGRFLKAENAERSTSELELGLIREQLKVARMDRSEAIYSDPKQVDTLISDIKAQLEPE